MEANNSSTLEPWASTWKKKRHVNFREKKLTLPADAFLIWEADKTETKLIPSKHFSSPDVCTGKKKWRKEASVCLVDKGCGNKYPSMVFQHNPRRKVVLFICRLFTSGRITQSLLFLRSGIKVTWIFTLTSLQVCISRLRGSVGAWAEGEKG